MRFTFARSLAVSVATALLASAPVRTATACGGFFVAGGSQSVDVASHRMILSISQSQSTLYDQVAYTGSPASFAWVLPIQGTVTVGTSSDALFNTLDQLTAVTVVEPGFQCPDCGSASGSFAATGTGATGGSADGGGGVTVVAQGTVGPYQTVQLSSTDPMALANWLSTNGYPISSAEQPIISAYVSAGFSFLAVKLQPGTGISAMQPITVTTPGASAVLPLRMVAAGVATNVPITLWVLGEGRYAPTNFPTFTIDPSQLVWDFATSTSNYAQLMQAGFAGSNGTGWLVQSAQPMSEGAIQSPVDYLVQNNPALSGYGDGTNSGAAMAEMADFATLFQGMDPTAVFVTRMLAQMPVTALASDMTLGASSDQSIVPQTLFASQYVNAPTCPPCSDVSASSGFGGAPGSSSAGKGAGGQGPSGTAGTGSVGAAGGTGGTGGATTIKSGCSLGGPADGALAVYGAVAALAMLARRRRSRG